MDKVRKFVSARWHIIMSFLAPALVLLIVYALKGIYPFGNRSISYYDMPQSYIPAYCYTWDVFHGLKSPFISFDAAMGCSMTDIMGFFVFFPTNLFFLFVPRDNMLGSMSFFLIIKLMLASGFMSMYVSKRTENKLYIFMAGFAYATSGYVVQYYTNIYYLDSVILLPVLLHALAELLSRRKRILYTLSIVCLMFLNPQMILPVAIYIVFKTYFLLRSEEDKKSRVKSLFDLIVCTLIGVLISGFSLIPSLIQTTASSRFERNQEGGIISILASAQTEFVCQKEFMLYGCEVAIAVIIAIAVSGKITLKKYSDSIVMIILLALPIVFENINLLWHGGSYEQFPMRFAYILSFECIVLTVGYLSDNDIKDFKYGGLTQLLGIAFAPVLCVILWVFLKGFQQFGIRALEAYNPYCIIVLPITVLFYFMAVISKKKQVRDILIAIMIIVQGTLAIFAFLAPTEVYSLECDNILAQKAEDLYDAGRQNNPLERYKDRNVSLTSNYGFISDVPSIGGWMNGINPNAQEQLERMGYSVNYTRLLDGCGTLFTDAMLGVRKIYSETDPNLEVAYRDTDSDNIYDCNYTLPNCFFLNDETQSDSRAFEYQNELFRNVTGVDKDLFETYLFTDLSYDIENNDGTYRYSASIDVTEPSVLYFFGEGYYQDSYAFAVNNEVVKLPYLTVPDNQLYAQFFLNGMVEVGEYQEGPLDLSVFTNFDAPYNIYVGLLKLSVLEEGIKKVNASVNVITEAGKREVNLQYKTTQSGNMFIPLEFNEGWSAEIDGTKTPVKPVLGDSFISIDAPEGTHTITLKFMPKGAVFGTVMTVIGILFFAGIIILDKKSKMPEIKVPDVLWSFYSFVVVVIVALMYVMPILSSIVVLLFGGNKS